MRRKILAFIILAVFLFTQTAIVDARSRGGSSFGSRSFSSSSSKSWSGSSRSSSSGWGSSSKSSWSGSSKSSSTRSSSSKSSPSKSSSSKSSSGYSGSSKSSSSSKSGGYAGSPKSSSSSSGSGTSRSVPGSYSTSGSRAKTSSSAATKKNTYMQDAYKKQASSSNYTKYKQKLNTEQQKTYDAAMNSGFSAKNRMNFEDSMRTRSSRINSFNTRRIYVNVNPVYFGSPFSYGHAYVGMWDLWFLMRASDLFWYHHWNEITPYRDYFEAKQFAEMEARIRTLEQQNNGVRDPNYLEEGVDPDLQMSDEYQQAHPDSVYYTNKYSSPSSNAAAVIIIIAILAVVLIIILRAASRAKPKKTYNSRIY